MMTMVEIVDRLQDASVLVMGDAMIDEYVHGEAPRMSPEAPVPVFVERRREERQGGAANVAQQLDVLSVTTRRDFAPETMWSRKTRYLVDGHQLLRIDADKISDPGVRFCADSFAAIGPEKFWFGQRPDAIVISDYNKGWVSAARCERLIHQARRDRVPVIVDPKGSNWEKYKGCTIICPNSVEAKEMPALMFERVLYKQGSRGMWLDDAGRSTVIPACATSVADVTGAGDTVVAVLAAALAVGADYVQAAVLANYAAGYVVGQTGTASCPIDHLRECAKRDDRATKAGRMIDYDLLACYTAP